MSEADRKCPWDQYYLIRDSFLIQALTDVPLDIHVPFLFENFTGERLDFYHLVKRLEPFKASGFMFR